MVAVAGPVLCGPALSTVTTGEEATAIEPHMETSPFIQAVRTVTDTDTNSSDVTTTIFYDQMSYILTIMVTISIISILLLIISLSTIFVFLW